MSDQLVPLQTTIEAIESNTCNMRSLLLGLLHSIGWFVTDILGEHISSVFKGQNVQDILIQQN